MKNNINIIDRRIKSRYALLGLLLLIVPVLCFQSCKRKNPLKVDVSGIEISPSFYHFEDVLNKIPDTLFFKKFPGVFPTFSLFFMQDEPDSLLMAEMLLFKTDPGFDELYEQKSTLFGDFKREKHALKSIMKHYHYYYSDAPEHSVYTHFSGLDSRYIETPVIVNDTFEIAIIFTDLFLGEDFEPYLLIGLPQYKRMWMIPEILPVEFARELALQKAGHPHYAETILDQMIFQGKLLYFTEAMMPETHDSLLIRFTKKQLEWCYNNQRHVWAYIVNNQMLYSTDYRHSKMLIMDGPFTGIFTEASPGRIGHWLGWQIVRNFMGKNPDLTVVDLMDITDSRKILSESGFSPR